MIGKSGIHREMAALRNRNELVGGAIPAQPSPASHDVAVVMARAIESPIPLEHFDADVAADAEIAPGRQGSRSTFIEGAEAGYRSKRFAGHIVAHDHHGDVRSEGRRVGT